MSGDRTGETAVSATLSEATTAWLEERAAEQGVPREELLRGLVAALRAADEDGVAPATRDDLSALRETVQSLDVDTDEKIQDVRQRVVQVKREADEKAPADHDHPEMRERVEEARSETEALSREVATLRDRADDLAGTVEDLERSLDGGFSNYEEVLEYLTDEADRLGSDFDSLAETVAGVRGEVRALAGRVATAAGVEQLREAANRHGVRAADCEECGGGVDVALLTRPACPHCGATFADVEPRRGFLGTHTLVAGEVPALEGGDDPFTEVESTDEAFDDLDPFDTDD